MRPLFTIAGLLLPALGVAAAVILAERTPGLAAVAVFVYLILGSVVLGAACTLLALVRGEPWRKLQVLLLLVNLGGALFFGTPYLREKPVPPIPAGEPAFLSLAPVQARLTPQAIFLSYPVPDSPEAQRGYVIGQRDARGVVASVRMANFDEPLGPREFRLQLTPAKGRWSMGRDGDHLRHLSDRDWKQGTYLEVRVNTLGWGVPVGIADQDLRPVGAVR